MVQGKGPEGPLVPGGAKGGACALLGRGGRPPSPSCAASAGLPSAETEAAESAGVGALLPEHHHTGLMLLVVACGVGSSAV